MTGTNFSFSAFFQAEKSLAPGSELSNFLWAKIKCRSTIALSRKTERLCAYKDIGKWKEKQERSVGHGNAWQLTNFRFRARTADTRMIFNLGNDFLLSLIFISLLAPRIKVGKWMKDVVRRHKKWEESHEASRRKNFGGNRRRLKAFCGFDDAKCASSTCYKSALGIGVGLKSSQRRSCVLRCSTKIWKWRAEDAADGRMERRRRRKEKK